MTLVTYDLSDISPYYAYKQTMFSQMQDRQLLLTISVSPLQDPQLIRRTCGHFSHLLCLRSPRRCGISSGQRTGSDNPVQVYRYRSVNSVGSLVLLVL